MVGGLDGGQIVLDHNHRIALVAELDQRAQQTIVVALMQANAGLVQNVEHADQAAADLGGQADALGLAARERAALAGKRQVVQPHSLEETKAGANFLDDLGTNSSFLALQVQAVDEGDGIIDAERTEVMDGAVTQGHGDGGRLETGALAVGADLVAHQLPQAVAHGLALSLPEAPHEVGDDALEGLAHLVLLAAPVVVEIQLLLAAVEQNLPGRFRQLLPRGGQVEVVMLGQAAQEVVVVDDQTARSPSPGGNGASADGEGGIRDEQLGDDDRDVPQAVAAGARAVGAVEGEVAGHQFAEAEPAIQTGQVLAEHLLAPTALGFLVLYQHHQDTFPQAQRQFDGIREATGLGTARNQAVDHCLKGVPTVLIQLDLPVKRNDLAIDPGADEAIPLHGLEDFAVLALAPLDVGSEEHESLPFGKGLELVADRLGALPLNGLAASRAMGNAHMRIEQAQIIVDLGGGGHRGARVAARRTLLDGDGGGEPLDVIHLGLLQPIKELPRVSGQALHIAPLPLGIERVEGERRLARTTETGDDHQRVPRDRHVDVLQVMLAGTLDADFVGHGGRFAC